MPFGSNVRRLKKKGDLEKLVELLDDKNPGVRTEARAAIVELRHPRATDLLVGAVQRKGWGRREAAQALLALRDPRSVEELLGALETSTEFDARGTIVDVLAGLGDDRAIEPLARLLNDSSEGIRARSVTALEQFGPKAVEALKRRLSGDSVSDLNLLMALTKLGDADASARLVSVVGDKGVDDDTRCDVAIFLSQQVKRGKTNSPLGESWDQVRDALEEFQTDDASLHLLVYEFTTALLAEDIARIGSRLAQFGDAALEPLLTAIGDRKMLARYQAVAPMTREEAGALILELSRARIERYR